MSINRTRSDVNAQRRMRRGDQRTERMASPARFGDGHRTRLRGCNVKGEVLRLSEGSSWYEKLP